MRFEDTVRFIVQNRAALALDSGFAALASPTSTPTFAARVRRWRRRRRRCNCAPRATAAAWQWLWHIYATIIIDIISAVAVTIADATWTAKYGTTTRQFYVTACTSQAQPTRGQRLKSVLQCTHTHTYLQPTLAYPIHLLHNDCICEGNKRKTHSH
jgi:hypothetical protein